MKLLPPPPKDGKKHGPSRDRKTGRVFGGNPGNKGGGRPAWAWRDEMRRALQEGRAAVVLQRIISGDILEILGRTEDGTPIVGETKNADRVKAIQLAVAYAEGLPVQPTIDITPREPAHLTAQQLRDALPRLVGVLSGEGDTKARLLEALEVDATVVE